VLLTGLHAVADIYCGCCKKTLGWKYVRFGFQKEKKKKGEGSGKGGDHDDLDLEIVIHQQAPPSRAFSCFQIFF
jgi:hypothetical protein